MRPVTHCCPQRLAAPRPAAPTWPVALLTLATLASAAPYARADAATADAGHTLVFTASLDGKPIGQHRYAVSTAERGSRALQSSAAFDVKFLGFTAYRYRHDDAETWTDAGCLAELTAATDDGGKKTAVQTHAEGGEIRLQVDPPMASPQALTGCVQTFPLFYWTGGMATGTARPTHLLDPQNGRLETVHIEDAASGPIDVRGATVTARHLRIVFHDGPIDLWYSQDGDWLALDAMVKGRKLTYRLQ